MQQRARGRQLMIIGIVVVVLVIGVGFVLSHSGGGGGGSPSAQASGSQPVVVALQPISQGTIFKVGQSLSGFFGVKQIPSNVAPVGAYSSLGQIEALTHTAGCGGGSGTGCSGEITVAQAISQNSPVLPTMLSALGQYRQSLGPSFSIPYGYVAMAVSLDAVNSVYGSISPGDDVDVIASYDPDVQHYPNPCIGSCELDHRTTQYALNDIRVISVNSPPTTGTPPTSGTTAPASTAQTQTVLILLVKYQQALILQHLKDFNWATSVVLRSAKETDIIHFRTTSVSNKWFYAKNPNSFVPGY